MILGGWFSTIPQALEQRRHICESSLRNLLHKITTQSVSGRLENMEGDSFPYTSDRDTDPQETHADSTNTVRGSSKCQDEVFIPISDKQFMSVHTLQNPGQPDIKEEPCFYDEGSTALDHKPSLWAIKEEPGLRDSECSTLKVHAQSVHVKDEALTQEGSLQQVVMSAGADNLHGLIKEEPSDAEMSTPCRPQCPVVAVKEESFSSEEDDDDLVTGTVHPFSITSEEKLTGTDPTSSKITYSCPVCNRIFDSHGNLSRHRETHKGVKMSCLVCGANFCNKMDLSTHAKEHRVSHGSSKMAHPCPVCKRTFNTHADLVRHRETHKGKTMSCKECGADFCNKTDLAAHARVHRVSGTSSRSSATCTCPVCKRTFNSPGNLIKHSESQKGVRVSCLQCGAPFCNKTDLAAHARKHRVGKVFPCSECDETFPSLSHLMVHKTTHSGDKLLTCAHCGKRFTDESDFVQHVSVHTVIREFRCTVCGKSHAREEDLLSHHLQAHEEEQTIICPECGLAFVDQDTLDRHLRFHKLHKPFSCGLCGKQFVHKTELVRHERTHVN